MDNPLANLQAPQPVTNFQQGRRFRMGEQQAEQGLQRGQQQMRMAESSEQRAQSGELRAEETHEANKKKAEWEKKMQTDKKAREDEIYETEQVGRGMFTVLEAPDNQKQAVWSQVYQMLPPDIQKQFPDGQYDEAKAFTLAQHAVSVMDRLKMMMKDKELSSKETVAKTKASKEGEIKSADRSLLRRVFADSYNANYDEKTGNIIWKEGTKDVEKKMGELEVAMDLLAKQKANGEAINPAKAVNEAKRQKSSQAKQGQSVGDWLANKYGPR